MVGVFAIAHSIGYFLDTGLSLDLMFNSNIRYIDSFLAWWFLAFFVTIPLLITSNTFSIIKLWKNWKKIQALAYLMFIFTIIHVALIKEDEFFPMMLLLWLYLLVLLWAYFQNKKKLK